MTFGQFDISGMVRCPQTNEEGFRCRLRPNHEGEHIWERCDWTDDRGARCMLPHRHPGRHALFWYDEVGADGTRRTLEFSGTEPAARRLADKAAGLAATRGWAEIERRYVLGLGWRIAPLAAFLRLFADPQGAMRVTFERGSEPETEDGGE